MGKRGKKNKGSLGGLADALVRAGVSDEKRAQQARSEKARADRDLGRDAVAEREGERQRELAEHQRREADASREREREQADTAETDRVQRMIREHREPARGPKRWHFVARDGRVPFLEVTDGLVRQLTDGEAGIVESLGAAAEEHVVVADRQALAALAQHDAEVVRFWNSSARPARLVHEARLHELTGPLTMLRETVRLGDREVVLESGRIARQAGGSVLLTAGDTVLLATATADRAPTRLSYMPLTTEYRARYSAVGRLPGTRERREMRPDDQETLTSRLIDRSVRPFFPGNWAHDTQVIVQPLSFEPGTDARVLGIAAAAGALAVSDIPWDGPVAGVRVGLLDGTLVAFPPVDRLSESELDLVLTVSRDGLVMVEGSATEVPEATVLEAFALAREVAAPLLDALGRLGAAGRPPRPVPAPAVDEGWREEVLGLAEQPMREALAIADKLERHRAIEAVGEQVRSQLAEDAPDPGDVLASLEKRLIREGVLAGRRLGGRGPTDVRAITGEAGLLPRCHGSSLFTRGETQAIVTCTLAATREARPTDGLEGRQTERFLLHYNFPPYCVGETRPLRGPGRREIGHGSLARRALLPVLPTEEEAPYTMRLESLITESNGSSSMATVCGSTLALFDAGIPLARPVAGIAMGLVKEGDRFVVLSDILGDEDHVGDMDFKVCGTERGVTAIQLDNKLGSLPDEVMANALEQAREGRACILDRMAGILAEPRPTMGAHAPRAASVRAEPNRVGALIGPGGKTVRGLQADLEVEIDIGDDGTIRIYGLTDEALRRAEARVRDLTGIPRIGETYQGTVVSVQPFGTFVRLFEGIEGLLHDEALGARERVAVRVTGVSERGRIVLERARSS